MSCSESSQTMTDLVWQATSCHATPSLYLLFWAIKQASSWYSCHPSMVIPTSKSSLDFTISDTFMVIRLLFSGFSSQAPVSLVTGLIGSWYSFVSCTSPEPSINIDGLQVISVAAFAFEIALP